MGTIRKYGKYLTYTLVTIQSPPDCRSVFPRMGRSMPVPFCRRTAPIRLDESGCPLADHDRWSGRVPGRHLSETKPRNKNFSLHYIEHDNSFVKKITRKIYFKYSRHDGRVSNAQSSDSVHPQLRVDHRHFVGGRAHFTRSRLMILRPSVLAHGASPVIVA